MKKWNLIIDVGKCHNSNNCFLSVVDEYQGNDHPGYSAAMPKHGHHWIDHLRKERGQAPMVDLTYVPTMCNHCDNAPCIKLAENGAVTKRSDGIVIIDPEKAKGQRKLVDSCPYGAIWWNDEKEIPQTWIFDAHLLDRGWKEPRPVQAVARGVLPPRAGGPGGPKNQAGDGRGVGGGGQDAQQAPRIEPAACRAAPLARRPAATHEARVRFVAAQSSMR